MLNDHDDLVVALPVPFVRRRVLVVFVVGVVEEQGGFASVLILVVSCLRWISVVGHYLLLHPDGEILVRRLARML